jgi:hypothetical protein
MYAIFLAMSLLLLPAMALGQPYIYPTRGQNQQQQSKDRYECHTWAVGQTGFDPSRPQVVQAPAPQPEGQVLKGAARGAALGAVGGAIAGDAGRGAAAGAAMGGLFGAMKRMDQARSTQQTYQTVNTQQRSAYDRALAACLEGRGYTVR